MNYKASARQNPFASIAKAPASKPSEKMDDQVNDEDEEDLEDDENDDEDTKAKKKAKRAKRAKQAQDDDKKDDDDSKCRAARQRERARCAAIFASPEAVHNIVATCHVAFMTSMPRAEAIGTLAALHASDGDEAAKPSTSSLATAIIAAGRKARGESSPRSTAKAQGADTTAAAIIAAGKKARGEA